MRRSSLLAGWMLSASLLVWSACSGSGGQAECVQDSDCPAGRYCQLNSQTCTFDCTFDRDCPDGYRCTARGHCEPGCVRTNNGVEACDGLDNDCDEQTDEDFPDLGQACQNGACQGEWVCAADGSAQVCNAATPADMDETCDGLDDDCDGQADEDAADRACPLQAGVCAGAMQSCGQGAWTACDYGPAYTPDADAACDQIDSDCDGATDEDAQPLLQPEAGDQSSDGVDNNCNGIVDEPGGLMIRLRPPATGWIDAYEITVFDAPDCTGSRYGQGADDYPAMWPAEGPAGVDLYACSVPDVIPSGWLSWHRAKRACEAQGKQLCNQGQWGHACYGGEVQAFPYGPAFVPFACNDAWSGDNSVHPTGSFPGCTSGLGEFDLSGNLAEWLITDDPDYPGNAFIGTLGYICELCQGGSQCHPCDPADPGDAENMQDAQNCRAGEQNEESFPKAAVRADFGARCCLDP